jgi:membrane-associated protease RseP (regulator of RpoE activity)
MEGDAADAPGAPRAELELDRPDKTEDDDDTRGGGLTRHVDEMKPVDPYPDSAKWQSKNGWQKALILVAGPLMNFLLALIVILCMGIVGFPERTVVISSVVPGSPADEVGIQIGDQITSVNGTTVVSSIHFVRLIRMNSANEIALEYVRGDQSYSASVQPRVFEIQNTSNETDLFNEGRPSIGIESTDIDVITPVVSLVQPKTAGYDMQAFSELPAVGLNSGDLLLSVNGQKLESAGELASLLPYYDGDSQLISPTGKPIEMADTIQLALEVQRGSNTMLCVLPAGTTRDTLGLGLKALGDDYTVTSVTPGSAAAELRAYVPAEERGFKLGDRVLAVDKEPVEDGFDVYLALPPFNMTTGKPVRYEVERDDLGEIVRDEHGNPVLSEIQLTAKTSSVHVLEVEREGQSMVFIAPWDTTGLSLGIAFKPKLQHLPARESLARSLQDVKTMIMGFMLNMRMLFTEQGARSIAGPVGIVALISQSVQSGWYTFLQIVILINVSIGFLNLLPIPALDGGRLVFVILNGVGIKIPAQREALVHLVGFVMLIGLIIVITFTDILAFF